LGENPLFLGKHPPTSYYCHIPPLGFGLKKKHLLKSPEAAEAAAAELEAWGFNMSAVTHLAA